MHEVGGQCPQVRPCPLYTTTLAVARLGDNLYPQLVSKTTMDSQRQSKVTIRHYSRPTANGKTPLQSRSTVHDPRSTIHNHESRSTVTDRRSSTQPSPHNCFAPATLEQQQAAGTARRNPRAEAIEPQTYTLVLLIGTWSQVSC